MDDGATLQLLGEDIGNEFQHIVIEQAEGPVDEHPGRRLNQHSRKYQAKLFVLAQLSIPTASLIEQRCEPFEPEAKQGPGKSIRAEMLRLQGVCKHFPQIPPRQIWCAARQIDNLLASGADDAARTP